MPRAHSRAPRTFLEFSDAACAGDEIALSEESHHHLCRVLRMNESDTIRCFNGAGLEWLGHLTRIEKKQSFVQLDQQLDDHSKSALAITLYLALVKNDPFDWAIQKAAELGVSSIQPVISEFTQGRHSDKQLEKKMRHWQSILVSACEQSENNWLPELRTPESFAEAVASLAKTAPTSIAFIAHPDIDSSKIPQKIETCSLWIGPEGGFSDNEVIQCKTAGYYGLNLGPRILRAETAVITGIGLLQARYGDLRDQTL